MIQMLAGISVFLMTFLALALLLIFGKPALAHAKVAFRAERIPQWVLYVTILGFALLLLPILLNAYVDVAL